VTGMRISWFFRPTGRSLALGAGLAALCGSVASAQTAAITTTPIEHTRFEEVSNEVFARHWGLAVEDATKYRTYMNVEGRYYYAHLDPVMVLGIIETDPAKRARFAEQYLHAERRRITEQTRFAALVAATQMQRFGPEAVVDFSTLPQARNTPGYRRARAERLGLTSSPVDARPTDRDATSPSITPQAGDVIDLLIDAGCAAACYEKLDQVLKTPDIPVQLYGRGFKDIQQLVAWLDQWPSPANVRSANAGRISPRRYDPLVFKGFDHTRPVALLRRQGVVLEKR